MIFDASENLSELCDLHHALDAAIAAKERAERERDEAKEQTRYYSGRYVDADKRARKAERERDEALAALRLAEAECEAAKQLVDAHRTLNWCMNVENLHAVNQAAIAYDVARRARIATTTPESPDDSKEDA